MKTAQFTEALREAMSYLWENPEKSSAMGRLAKVRYWQYFTSEKMVNSYIDLYETLLRKKSINHIAKSSLQK